jgi:hypothetical protein
MKGLSTAFALHANLLTSAISSGKSSAIAQSKKWQKVWLQNGESFDTLLSSLYTKACMLLVVLPLIFSPTRPLGYQS